MKIGGLGAVAIAVGLVVGVDGLVLSGALWLVLGVLAWALVGRHEKEERRKRTGDPSVDALLVKRDPERGRRYLLGLVLILTIGLGSLAIGLLGIGFDGGSDWRWVPIAVGGIVTFLALLTIPARLGAERWGPGGPHVAETPARVTIEGKRQTGVYINEQPRIEFDLLVEPDGLPSYRVTKKATVPSTALSDIGIGDGFEAKVRPGDEDRIAIDWDAPLDHADADPAARLERLEDLRRRGLIDGEEYEAQRKRIIGSV